VVVCKARGTKKVKVTCKVTMTAAPARASVTLRLSHVGTTYASGGGSLRAGRATIRLRVRHALVRDRYTLRVVLRSPHAPRGVITQRIGLR
jgi:hypothetical protein